MVRRPSARRTGAIIPLVAILMIFLLAMVAFAVDVGYICVVQKEMQNAADAAALAGTAQLLDRDRLRGLPNGPAAVAHARNAAKQFSALNTGGGVALHLDGNGNNDPNGDIVCGYLANPSDFADVLSTAAASYNSVHVRVRRTAEKNGPLQLFFGPIFSKGTQDMYARATATYEGGSNVTGFRITGTGATTVPLLPFTLDLPSWTAVLAGTGPDDWTFDPVTRAYAKGTDGIKEVNLYPTKGISPGSLGTIDLGSANNSAADIERQIRDGLNQADLDAMGGEITLGPTGTLTVQGDAGVSAGFKDALADIRGQKRIIPIYAPPPVGQGNTTYFTIVGFGGITILDVKMTGMNKQLTVQPEYVLTPTAVVGTGVTVPNWFVYRPLRLTR